MKKGQMIQFNLIFVIIVGVIILAFFLFFTSKYIDMQNKKEAAEIGRDINNIMRGLQSTTQHKNLTIAFDFDLRVGCNDIGINNKYIQDVDSIFFGSNGPGRKIVFWSKEFGEPFRVANVIYLIDNTKKYYSSDSSFFNSNFVNIGDASNYDVGVFFGGSCPGSSFDDRKIVCVEGNNINIDGQNFPLVDEAVIYGAAFSEVQQFNCSLQKLKSKWINLVDIYAKKNELSSGCMGVRQQLDDSLINLKNNLESGIYDYDYDGLDTLNTRLYSSGCAVVY